MTKSMQQNIQKKKTHKKRYPKEEKEQKRLKIEGVKNDK